MGLFDSILGGVEADPYAKKFGDWSSTWMGRGKKPINQFMQYLQGLYQNPFGPEFQTAWGQYRDQSQRQYGTLSNNLSMQVANRMGGADNSTMPGLLGYLTRMQGQDENDWLRNYATTAKQDIGLQILGNYQGLIAQQSPGLSMASQSYQQSAANRAAQIQALMQALGYAYGMGGIGGGGTPQIGGGMESSGGDFFSGGW